TEIAELEAPRQARAALGHRPHRRRLRYPARLVLGEGRNAPAARDAFLRGEVFRSHAAILVRRSATSPWITDRGGGRRNCGASIASSRGPPPAERASMARKDSRPYGQRRNDRAEDVRKRGRKRDTGIRGSPRGK